MDWNTVLIELFNICIGLINVIIWPIVVGIAMFLYRKPLSTFIARLGHRVTKLSAFDISIELAALQTPPSLWTDLDNIQSSEMRGGEVYSTAIMDLFQRIGADKPLDYQIIDVKDGRFWFVSRVFIFTIFLQAMLSLKCVVFVQTTGENRHRLLGLSSIEAIRMAFGHAFPWLERALENALNKHAPNFLGPALPRSIAGEMIRSFIEERNMRLMWDPEVLLKTSNNCPIPEEKRPTDSIKSDEWQRLGKMNIWEHTHWLDLNIHQVSEAVTKSFFEPDESIYNDSPNTSTDKRIRELLLHKAPYIALVNSRGEFKCLLDRQKLAALVGETLVKS